MLWKKLYNIDTKGSSVQNKKKVIFEYKKNVKDGNKKKEIVKMAQENLHMLKRLESKTSYYNFNKYEKEYDKAQYYKRSHCAFPAIDFYKTQRASSFGNNYSYNPYHSQNNYYPTVSSKFYNINSHKKKFEDFHYEDFADIRTNSKKIKINCKQKEENKKQDKFNDSEEENNNKDNNKDNKEENRQEEDKKDEIIENKENNNIEENKENEKNKENKDEQINNEENEQKEENKNNEDNEQKEENKNNEENEQKKENKNNEENEQKEENSSNEKNNNNTDKDKEELILLRDILQYDNEAKEQKDE